MERGGSKEGQDRVRRLTGTELCIKQIATRIYCTTQRIQPVFYNFKWNIIYKNIESLCYIPVNNVLL